MGGWVTAAVLTYVLASLFAIIGMGAAGVLIPNYVVLGIPLPVALAAPSPRTRRS
jgi:uncharacterized membrane protein YfcA